MQKNNFLWNLILIGLLIFPIYLNTVAAGTLLVTNDLTNSVTLLDEPTLTPIQSIKVDNNPHEIVVTADGKYALISHFGDILNRFPGDSISMIDIQHSTLIKTIKLPKNSRPHGLAFLSENEVLVTAQGLQSLLVVNYETGALIKQLALPGNGAHLIVVDRSKSYGYITNTESGTLTKIDLKSFAVVQEVKIGQEVEGIDLSPRDDLLLVANRKEDYVAVINPIDLTVLKKIPTQHGPSRVTLYDEGKSALVTNTLSSSVQIIDIKTLSIKNTFKTAGSNNPNKIPVSAYINDIEKSAYIANLLGGIPRIDLTTGEITKLFDTDFLPNSIAFSPLNAIKSQSDEDTLFSSGPIEINASIEKVWRVVKDIENYELISNGAITAHVDGEILPGKTIHFELYKNKPVGKVIPPSNETVTLVDDNLKILAWTRKLPDGNYTLRYQFLEKLSENKTRSKILLYMPGPLGKVTRVSLGKVVDNAFDDLHSGIKNESER